MTRATKLVHPATLFIQSLPYTEVALKDMTPMQQRGIYDFMNCGGDGVWADNTDSFDDAMELYGDVRFGVGTFANDDTFKDATLAASDDADTEKELWEWFKDRYVCGEVGEEQPPVILNNADLAPEFGLFEWGYEWFHTYWAHLPEIQFIRFLPDWDGEDEAGRGGQ